MVISKETCAVIIALHKSGLTGNKIAPESTIYRIIKNFKERFHCCQKGSRRPRKTSKRQDHLFKVIQLRDRATSSAELAQKWQQAGMNFESVIKKEEGEEVPEVEPPDVFSIIEASNRGGKMLLQEGDIAVDVSRSAMKCDGNTCRWNKNSNGQVNVPYTLSPNFRADFVSNIKTAMQEFATLTCVWFVPRTAEADYVKIITDSGCWSYIGKQKEGQELSLDSDCNMFGTIQHELNHALGFYHEQSRSDRDSYVDIKEENIIEGAASHFRKYNSDNLGLEYDYSSVMHYGRFAFSKGYNLPTIVPKPDDSVPIGQRYGLSTLDVAKINKLYDCGLCRGLLTNSTGTIISSNYPNQYPSDTSCVYLIRIPSNQIFLQFSAFDVQSSPNCTSDYIRIYDGADRSAPLLLDRSCGAGQMLPLVSTGNKMLIEFSSDDKMGANGFKASYSTVNCGSMLTSTTGTVSSPMYPNKYPPSMDCTWVINAPAGFEVSLNITNFNVEYRKQCTFDYLLVFNGPKVTSPLIGQYCGQGITVPSIRSTGNTLLLQFHSDKSIQATGFYGKYAFVPE
ncbi:embryonic protein UVS.2-like [Dendropsophus ebraccatus]|uniref:embryonic protein UVS.2-like n=1 Tax=Dendropsophus ebraccatus TaxID=150705 RepID=UPI0038321C4C